MQSRQKNILMKSHFNLDELDHTPKIVSSLTTHKEVSKWKSSQQQ